MKDLLICQEQLPCVPFPTWTSNVIWKNSFVLAMKIVQLYYNWTHNVVVEGNIMSDMHN